MRKGDTLVITFSGKPKQKFIKVSNKVSMHVDKRMNENSSAHDFEKMMLNTSAQETSMDRYNSW